MKNAAPSGGNGGQSTPGFGGSTPSVWWINTRFWWINNQCLVDKHKGLMDQHQVLVDQHPGFGGSTALLVQPAAPLSLLQRCRWAASGATEMQGRQLGALGWGQPAAQRAAARQPAMHVIGRRSPRTPRVFFVIPAAYRFASKTPGFCGSTPRVWWINTRFLLISTRVWWINDRF